MIRARYFTLVAVVFAFSNVSRVAALPTPAVSLSTCQDRVRSEGRKAVKNTLTAVSNCLSKVAADVLKNNVAITAKTSKSCVAEFRKLNDTRTPPADKDIEAKFRGAVDKKCVPLFTPSQTHTFADIMGAPLGTVEDIKTTNINTWCKHFGGDGTISDVPEWETCMIGSHNCEAAAAIAAQYPRAAEWIAALIVPLTNMNIVPAPASDLTKTTDAVAGATAFLSVLDPDGDGINSPSCGGEAVACLTGCCYVENPPTGAPSPADAHCFEYTGTAAGAAAFFGPCFGPGFTGFQFKTAIPGPCIASPSFGIPCIPGINLMLVPTDSSCP
jgi:hypothetical protein